MQNKIVSADHGRTIVRTPHRRGAYWLSKRRDGRSPVWMITWYDAAVRTLRYRSTKSLDLAGAKSALDAHAAVVPAPAGATQTRSRAQFVYFIGGDVGGVKIGSAAEPERRLTSLQCGSPIPLRILAVMPGGRKLERELHARFAAHRLHGEWFTHCPEIEAEIAHLNTITTVSA